jgi:hypothetical protein
MYTTVIILPLICFIFLFVLSMLSRGSQENSENFGEKNKLTLTLTETGIAIKKR